jgi:hypothetical protein
VPLIAAHNQTGHRALRKSERAFVIVSRLISRKDVNKVSTELNQN